VNNATPCLRDLQTWLQWIITDPRGVSQALGNPHPIIEKYKERYTEPTDSHLLWIEDKRIGAGERLSVYAEGYFFRILECLEKDFSRTRKVLGPEIFASVVAEYLKAHPSRFYSIDEVGYKFAPFMSEYKEVMGRFPWIGDLALFEWEHIQTFYGKDGQTTNQEWQENLSKIDPSKLQFQVHPSVHLLKSNWPLSKIIKNSEMDGGEWTFRKKNESLILFRDKNDQVVWEKLDAPAFEILNQLRSGATLEETISRVNGVTTELFSKIFSEWVEKGLLCGIARENRK